MKAIVSKIPHIILSFYVIFCVSLLVWVVKYSGSGDGDTLEHVHSSWLVYLGKVPYKDFFQHHNPLLWYLGAPLVGYFKYSLAAVDAVNYLTVLITTLTMLFIFLINKKYLSNSVGGLIAAAFFAFPHDSLYNKDFKPDNFMVFAIVVGLYYLLKYIKKRDLLSLCVSFLSFFISFMFTQKAVLILLGIGIIILYLIYDKKVSIKDCLYSAIIPILIFFTYLVYLHHNDILSLYFKANFELNTHIPSVFHTRRFIYPNLEMDIPILFSMLGCFIYLYKDNTYAKV